MLFLLSILYAIDISFDLGIERASGNTLYVNTTGDGGAYTNIQDAINAAGPGDTVYVYEGVYYENLLIDKAINLTGENRNNTIIDGYRNNYVVNISADWVNMTGFLVMNGSTSYLNAGVEIIESSNCTIYGCNIRYK